MAFRGKCTFGTRPAMDRHLLNEYIYREIKHFHNYSTYRPNFRALPVTGKFYAAHDLLKESEEQRQKVDEYADRITGLRARGPHSKYSEPVTSNHEYGWYVNPLAPLGRNDSTYQRGRVRVLRKEQGTYQILNTVQLNR